MKLWDGTEHKLFFWKTGYAQPAFIIGRPKLYVNVLDFSNDPEPIKIHFPSVARVQLTEPQRIRYPMTFTSCGFSAFSYNTQLRLPQKRNSSFHLFRDKALRFSLQSIAVHHTYNQSLYIIPIICELPMCALPLNICRTVSSVHFS